MRHRILLTLIPVMGLAACYKSILYLLRREERDLPWLFGP
jgi:hypothetical protein